MPYKDKIKQNIYQKQWISSRRSDYFRDKACRVCGSIDQLELDHINPETKVSHSIWSWSSVKREEELLKCQILCKVHHSIKTRQENSRPITHGNSGYRRGCRCCDCKLSHSLRMKLRKRSISS